MNHDPNTPLFFFQRTEVIMNIDLSEMAKPSFSRSAKYILSFLFLLSFFHYKFVNLFIVPFLPFFFSSRPLLSPLLHPHHSRTRKFGVRVVVERRRLVRSDACEVSPGEERRGEERESFV